jgi:hypothetical protein
MLPSFLPLEPNDLCPEFQSFAVFVELTAENSRIYILNLLKGVFSPLEGRMELVTLPKRFSQFTDNWNGGESNEMRFMRRI